MRESWTDERLDDFRGEVSRRFDEAATEVNRRFDEVNRELRMQRAETSARFERVESRLDDLNRTMMRFGGGAILTFVVGFAGMIATQL